MAKRNFKSHRRAFTLVELLIVIIIIGILAGMMMLSAGAATDKATATRIISDTRTMKAAAVMYKADYGSWPLWIYDVDKYVNKDASGDTSVLPGKYFDVDPVGDGYWIGAMKLPDGGVFAVAQLTAVSDAVKKSLESAAEGGGLYGVGAVHGGNITTASLKPFKATDKGLVMIISK